jgi:membrane-associated phospholipid phosphatase
MNQKGAMQGGEEGLIALAQVLGRHALPGFLALLVLLLVATALLWWRLHRMVVPSESSSLSPGVFMLRRLGFGFVIVVGASWLFVEVAEEIGGSKQLGRLDQAFSDALRESAPHAAVQVFAWVTRLGDTVSLTGLCIAVALWLLVLGKRWLALGWVAAVAGNALLNVTLKGVFERVRPLHEGGPVTAHGWSFPSGHSSGAVVAYGMLAYVLMRLLPLRWHLPLALAAAAIAFSIGCSRIFLQVHFASDVLAGFASGAVWLAVCVNSIQVARYYRQVRRRPPDAGGNGSSSSERDR